MNTTAKQIGVVLLAGVVVATIANGLHPRGIPWVQDWSHQVESRAADAEIRILPLSVALDRFHAGKDVFLDARSITDYTAGHIPGALSVPFESWEDSFPVLADLITAGRTLIVYCSSRTCDDAVLLAIGLQDLGADVAVMVDGFEAWSEHVGEVEP